MGMNRYTAGDPMRLGVLWTNLTCKKMGELLQLHAITAGIDVDKNKCYLTIGKTKDTAEFVCDNIEHHWESSIKHLYPTAKKMLVLCDGGGSNSCRHYVVKEQLQKLAQRIKTVIVVAHYPAYCSK